MSGDFWETSSAAKLYLNEVGSEWAAARFSGGMGAISALAHAEMASLVARRCAEGEFDAAVRDALYREYLADSTRFQVIDVTDSILSSAARLILSGVFGT